MNERIPKNGKVNNYQTPIIQLELTVVQDKKDIKYIKHTAIHSVRFYIILNFT